MPKRYLGIDVLEAAQRRISRVFDDFARLYVAFSGGKDSGVLLHLVTAEARRRNRRFGVLFIDLEAQYKLTIDFVERRRQETAGVADFDWVALPIHLRNAVSQIEPNWICWDPAAKERWVRRPPEVARVDAESLPFFRVGMEFEEFVTGYGDAYADGGRAACFVGIRAQESYNRYLAVMCTGKHTHAGLCWTTVLSPHLVNTYPLYDWTVRDIWTYYGKTGCSYNGLYDRMHRAGISLSQQRVCEPFGDEQRRGLWMYHVLEPETWTRVVGRVSGANHGAIYAKARGNVLGRIRIEKPEGHSWRSYVRFLLDSLPPDLHEHYEAKILRYLKWYDTRGYPAGSVPDEPNNDGGPSWREVCRVLLRNDYWCNGIGFASTKSHAYEEYRRRMRKRKTEWGLKI